MLRLGRDNSFLWWSMLLWGLGDGLFMYIHPLYIQSLGAGPTDIGLVLSVAAAAMTLTYLPAGSLSDRTSRRMNLLIGWAVGVVGALLIALAPDWRWLMPGMIVFRMSGFVMPAFQSYVLAASRPGDAKRAYTLVTAAYSIGTVPTPLIGGWIGQVAGLRPVYLLATLLYVLSTLLVFPLAEQPIPARTAGSSYRAVFHNRRFMALCLVFTAILAVTFLGWPFAPNYLADVAGLNVETIGGLGVAVSLGAAALAILLSSARVPRRLGVVLGLGAVLASFLLLLYFPILPVLALAYFLRGANSANGALLTTWLAETLDPETLGRGFGIFNAVYSVGLTVMPYLTGWLYAIQPPLPFLLAAALVAPAIVLTPLLPHPRPAPTAAPHT